MMQQDDSHLTQHTQQKKKRFGKMIKRQACIKNTNVPYSPPCLHHSVVALAETSFDSVACRVDGWKQ